MRKTALGAAAVACCAALAAPPASAQEVCKALLAYGTFDSTDTFSDKEDFRLVQHLLCRSTITTHQQAVDAEAELGVPILEVLEIDFGGEVSTDTFETAQKAFCEKDYSVASNKESLITRIRTASQVLADAFVDCVTKTRGFFGYATQTKDKKAFAITLLNKVDGMNAFQIERIGYQPTDIACDGDAHKVTPEKPLPVIGSTIISCRNLKPEQSFQLTVATSIDDLGPVELAGLDETLADLTERVDKLEGRAVPVGTIAWFKEGNCPPGWSRADELAGRYAVGVPLGGRVGLEVGQKLANGEDRPAGQHQHSYKDIWVRFNGGHDKIIAQANKHGNQGRTYRTDKGIGLKAGTNAPYVQLLACRKE